MRRILVPTDFSPNAEKAILLAIDIATRCGASILLLHVFTPLESSFVETEAKRKEYNEQTENILEKKLDRLAHKLLCEGNVQVNCKITRSPVIKNILSIAKEENTDLIIMGTKGASGLKRKILGSTACSIIEKASIPVLLVPDRYEIKDPEEFVYVTSCEQTDSEALKLLMTIVRAYKAGFSVIHLQTEDQNRSREDEAFERFKKYSSQLQAQLEYTGTKYEVLKVNSIPVALESLHELIQYDILAMIRRPKNNIERLFLPSLTKNMALQSSYPLLVIPAKI